MIPLDKLDFRTIFEWMCWVSLLVFIGWVGLLFIHYITWGTKNGAIFLLFLMIALSNFAVDSLMKDNPDHVKKYFIDWLIASGFFAFLAFTIFVWLQ